MQSQTDYCLINLRKEHLKQRLIKYLLRFPVDPNRRRKWIDAVRRQNTWIPTKNHCICSIHFAEECYNANSTKQRKLHKDSIPTLNLPKFSHETKDDEIDIDGTYKTSTPVNGRQRNKDSSPEESEPELESEPTLELKIEPTDEQRPQCATCHEVILGFVFACVECNARSCSACDARGLHAAHLVLRAPVARPESELELVLNKIRDALCLDVEGTQTNPDQPVGETPQETKEDYIKMEIETEEEQPIWHESVSGAPANTYEEPDVEHQSMSWAGRDAGGDESDSSCTLTASTPSEDSSSDDDQALLVARPTRPAAPPTRPVAPPTRPAAPPTRPVAPPTRPVASSTRPARPPTRPAAPSTRPVAPRTWRAAPSTRPAASPTRPPTFSTRPARPPTRPPSPPGRPRFTDEMNRYIVQMYYKLSQTEKDPKKIFAQMKRAFAVSFPRTKVYRSNLQSQFSIINKKKLLSDHEIQMIRNDVCDTKTVNEKMNVSKLFTGKGRQLDLMTVRSETAETSSSISSSEKTSEVSPTPIVRTIVVPLRKPRREVIETSQEFKLPKAIQQVCTVVTESSDPKCPEQLSAALEISDSSQQH